MRATVSGNHRQESGDTSAGCDIEARGAESAAAGQCADRNVDEDVGRVQRRIRADRRKHAGYRRYPARAQGELGEYWAGAHRVPSGSLETVRLRPSYSSELKRTLARGAGG